MRAFDEMEAGEEMDDLISQILGTRSLSSAETLGRLMSHNGVRLITWYNAGKYYAAALYGDYESESNDEELLASIAFLSSADTLELAVCRAFLKAHAAD